MPYTEMDNITQTKLALISERARKDPKFQFTSLAHLLNEGFLKECYYDLGRDRARSIDGVSWKEYGEKLDGNINNLVSRLKAKRYRPLPAKWIYVPKNEHEDRPLGLPALEDKIVQKGVARILKAKLRGHFQYYGISGNGEAIKRYHHVTKRLVYKWVNRRSQKASYNWDSFIEYLKHYPLPEPRIVHHLYSLSYGS